MRKQNQIYALGALQYKAPFGFLRKSTHWLPGYEYIVLGK